MVVGVVGAIQSCDEESRLGDRGKARTELREGIEIICVKLCNGLGWQVRSMVRKVPSSLSFW